MPAARRLLLAAGGGSALPAQGCPPFDTSWSRYGSNPIMTPAVAWEETSMQEPHVMYEGGVWKMWYTGGWDHPALGYATSTDGIAWTKYPSNPVYGQGASSYAYTSDAHTIIKVGSTYWLFTSGGTTTTNPFTTFKVATSSDGIAWTTQSSSITIPSGKTLWGNRTVWIEGGTWYMLQEAGPTRWEIFLYTSSDGLTWNIGNGGSPLTTFQQHASGMYGGPTVAQVPGGTQSPTYGGIYHVWYHAAAVSGNNPTNIYHATSSDKITWTPNSVLTHTGSGDEADQIADPSVIVVGLTAYLFYDAVINATQRGVIMLATAPALF